MDTPASELPSAAGIRTKPYPSCILCGAGGAPLYSAQRDRWFGAEGIWNLKQCPNLDCGLIWLDPMPLAEDLVNAYTSDYYTHDPPSGNKPGFLRRMYYLAGDCHVRRKFGYPADSIGGPGRFLASLLRLFPGRCMNLEAGAHFLRWVPGGRLLDVGCGAGGWLSKMSRLGWQVEGVDFDPGAVEKARGAGFSVRCGSLEAQEYPGGTFDAVTMNHSIEHVPDPLRTIRECARILKSGGQLVLGTPNSQSLGHRFFKEDWIGLDPPRHLHVFSGPSMRRILSMAGLAQNTLHPVLGAPLIYGSFMQRQGWTIGCSRSRSNLRARIRTRLFDWRELWRVGHDPAAAENMTAVAVKP